MSSDRESELQPLIGDAKKQGGCCAKHPVLCASLLVFILVLSAVALVLGSVLHSKLDQTVQDAISDHVKLVQGSTATDQFKSSSAPLYSTYYFFNLTNPYEVTNKKAKPILKEMGPYVFRENRTCFNLTWLEGDTILRYNTNITYTWDREMSHGNDPNRDYITTVNVPLIGVFKTIDGMVGDSKVLEEVMKLLDEAKKKTGWEGLFIRKTVSDLLWGYEDSMLHVLSKVKKGLKPVFGFSNVSTVETPNMVYTGVGNLSNVSRYIQWNGHFNMSGWGDPYASQINGTGGYSFHPDISRDETLYVFINELSRSGYFNYHSDIVDHGITLYKFVLPDVELMNTTQLKEGFPANDPSGVLDLSSVTPDNVPIYASKPHFLHADADYRQNVSGMNPNASIHDSYLGVEPITGAVMNAAKRIQFNMKLVRNPDIPEFANVPDRTMLPIFYAEQRGAVTTELANEFMEKVYTVKYGVSYGVWAVVGLAGLLVVVSVMCMVGLAIQRHKRKKTSISFHNNV